MILINSSDNERLNEYGISPEEVRAAENKRGVTSSYILIDGEGRKRLVINEEQLKDK